LSKMKLSFDTKANTLRSLKGRLSHGRVLPQLCFTVENWEANNKTLGVLEEKPDWLTRRVIVRSSGKAEDGAEESLAGHYKTIANVLGADQLKRAIATVIKSFGCHNLEDQILIQPMLKKVSVSGVAFTRDPSNGSYYNIINYDALSGETDTVTGGLSNKLTTFIHAKNTALPKSGWLRGLLLLLQELEVLFNEDSLDVEFAVDHEGKLVVLQVRLLILSQPQKQNLSDQDNCLKEIEQRFQSLEKPHPYLLGERAIFGVMPDWNPAEIIGIRPRPLALSLYKELITDGTWAYQRDNYGYRNLRSFPLLVNFCGLPYIDVRVSFNSFIPKGLDESLADRLVNHYLDSLVRNPNNHDKVEFEVIFSCYTLDLPHRIIELNKFGFSKEECSKISENLHKLTQGIICDENGLWKKDIAKLDELKSRQEVIQSSDLSVTEKIYWLIEHCKRYGTLPFAGLARAGFVAVQLLKSMVNTEVLSENEYEIFMRTLKTVSSRMSQDLIQLGRKEFLVKYGHLRPGTYDILSLRYDEAPDQYFDWDNIKHNHTNSMDEEFFLRPNAAEKLKKLLHEHRLEHDVASFFNFIKGAIEGREYAKFVFTKSLSDALALIQQLGRKHDIDTEDLSYANINTIHQLYSSSENTKQLLNASIKVGRQSYIKTCALTLPPLITCSEDIRSFELPKNEPNFITSRSTKGMVVKEDVLRDQLRNNVLFLPSADPGYDWIFSHGIGGFITMYGSANSHMAIRAGELGIPAVIGAGEFLYQQWSSANFLEVDCANKQVRVLR
jgi:glutamine kinase